MFPFRLSRRGVTASLLALAVALPVAASAQVVADGPPRPITIEEAVTLARRNSPAAVQARGQLRSAAAAVRGAYAAFIPNLSVSLGTSYSAAAQTRTDAAGNIISGNWNANTGISANVELFDGGRRLYGLRSARADVYAAEAGETLQRYQVALDVKQQYFAVLAAREQEAAARAQLEQSEQQYAAAVARVRAGTATKSDSLRAIIQVGNARLALLTSDNALRVANATLTRLVAAPFPVTAASDSLETVMVSLDSAAIAAVVDDAPVVEQAEAQVTAARAEVRAARTPYLPTVNASFSYNGSGPDRLWGLGDEQYGYSDRLSVSLSYPLFNQFRRENAVLQARIAEDVAEAQLRDARLRARQDLIQYIGQLRSAEQRIEIADVSVAAATEDLRVQQQRYALGASTLLDVLTSQTQLVEAQSALIQARYDYRIAKAQLEAVLGRDL